MSEQFDVTSGVPAIQLFVSGQMIDFDGNIEDWSDDDAKETLVEWVKDKTEGAANYVTNFGVMDESQIKLFVKGMVQNRTSVVIAYLNDKELFEEQLRTLQVSHEKK